MPDVAETLELLRLRHTLYIVTKGDPDEQRHKVEHSGSRTYFRAIEVLPEKSVDTYRAILDLHDFDPRGRG